MVEPAQGDLTNLQKWEHYKNSFNRSQEEMSEYILITLSVETFPSKTSVKYISILPIHHLVDTYSRLSNNSEAKSSKLLEILKNAFPVTNSIGSRACVDNILTITRLQRAE